MCYHNSTSQGFQDMNDGVTVKPDIPSEYSVKQKPIIKNSHEMLLNIFTMKFPLNFRRAMVYSTVTHRE